MTMRADILIENATVIDGTGQPGIIGGVAVVGGEISAVGDISEYTSDHVIDGTDKVVAPGFIDCHTHDDRALLDDPDMACKVTQGVTTVVTGNCGVSLAPFVPDEDFGRQA